jgi:CRP-like cAMP-binding protein
MMESAGRSPNGFLKSLCVHDFEAIRPHLRTVELSAEFSLIRLGQAVTQVYFPHTAVVSLVVELDAGEQVEVAMVGPDSILGAFGALGEPVALINAVVMLPGSASVIEVHQLRTVAEQSNTLRETIVRHGQALFVQAQQTAACNASHAVEARLARWLLRVRDLSGRDRFKLTQELMAQMIGARRNSVSLVAHSLQQTNIIRYSRGHVEILDVPCLKRTACKCYEAVKAQFRRLQLPT